MGRRSLGSLASFASVAVGLGCGSGAATPVPPPPPVHVADAVPGDAPAAYAKLCAPCHAPDLHGGSADHAPSLNSPTFLESASDVFLVQSIRFGRPGTSMAGYSTALGGPLDDAAVSALVKLIRGKSAQPGDLPAPLPGDTVRGAAIYQRLCLTCHGDTIARGEAPHLANPRFLSQASDAFLAYAIVHGRPNTKMDAWAGKLGDQDVGDVVSYIRNFTGKVQPQQKLLPEPTSKEPVVLNPTGKSPVFNVRDGRFVGVDQVKAAVEAKQRIVIIDARPPSDWRRVHVVGAVSIPYFDMHRLDEVPKDGTWIVSYCACPHHLSGIVTEELRKRGYDHAMVLDEGIDEWHRRGYPVVAAEGVTAPPATSGKR
jgi:cytochrome c oxidase cbb3-type subunit 3